MDRHEHFRICLHADWKAWQSATARFVDIHDLHWHQPAGAPHALVHGYVACTDIVAGQIPHQCDPRTAPHRLRVCILKRHTTADVYAMLARLADDAVSLACATRRVSITLTPGQWH